MVDENEPSGPEECQALRPWEVRAALLEPAHVPCGSGEEAVEHERSVAWANPQWTAAAFSRRAKDRQVRSSAKVRHGSLGSRLLRM